MMWKPFPKITIALATYQPNLVWFCELLESLKKQTYPNYEIRIQDDASEMALYQMIQEKTKEILGEVPYVVCQNKKNIGSNLTFENLTCMAEGVYIAYCDQDDIWEEQKLEYLYKEVVKQNAIMVYSDMSVIDEKGEKCYSSLRQLRKRIRYIEGENLACYYLFSNCTAGCSMMIKSETAKQAVPFFKEFICDQWLSLYAAACGKIAFVDKALVRYRQHGKNQSGILKNISSKEAYYQERVFPAWHAVKELEKRKIHYKNENQSKRFAKARMERNIKDIWKYRYLCRKYAYFEILLKYIKKEKVNGILSRIRNG